MIDFSSYTLTEKNYYNLETDKKQIVIGNSFNVNMYHHVGWIHRTGGNYKKVSNFSVDREGKVFQHFDPKYYSDFLPNSIHNKKIISIILVNEGWLEYDIKDKKYLNSLGNFHKGNDILEKRWRSHSFWDTYPKKQVESLINLTKYLFEKYNITKKVLGHNTYVKDIAGFEGVTYRSNWIKDSTDLSPSFDFDIFKNKTEEDGLQ